LTHSTSLSFALLELLETILLQCWFDLLKCRPTAEK
jgi:hypothetical protein